MIDRAFAWLNARLADRDGVDDGWSLMMLAWTYRGECVIPREVFEAAS